MRTRVGYCGGSLDHPTYHNLGFHAETLQVDFDPERLSFSDLLVQFWSSHSPTGPPHSKQYRSAIFCHGDEQLEQARAGKARHEERSGRRLFTEIVAAPRFWPAEDYHQKYLLQQEPELFDELNREFSEARGWIDSTAAARLNGYLGGFGSREQWQHEKELLGISAVAIRRLEGRIGFQ